MGSRRKKEERKKRKLRRHHGQPLHSAALARSLLLQLPAGPHELTIWNKDQLPRIQTQLGGRQEIIRRGEGGERLGPGKNRARASS